MMYSCTLWQACTHSHQAIHSVDFTVDQTPRSLLNLSQMKAPLSFRAHKTVLRPTNAALQKTRAISSSVNRPASRPSVTTTPDTRPTCLSARFLLGKAKKTRTDFFQGFNKFFLFTLVAWTKLSCYSCCKLRGQCGLTKQSPVLLPPLCGMWLRQDQQHTVSSDHVFTTTSSLSVYLFKDIAGARRNLYNNKDQCPRRSSCPGGSGDGVATPPPLPCRPPHHSCHHFTAVFFSPPPSIRSCPPRIAWR